MSSATATTAQFWLARAWRQPLAPRIEAGDVLLAAVAATAGIALVTGVLPSPGRHGGVAAALASLLMTAPVVLRHRVPVVVCLLLGAGAVLNAVAIGPMVRCGAALPVLFLAAFTVGSSRPWRTVGVGVAALFGSAVVQSRYDPDLSVGILAVLGPALVGFACGGLLLAQRRRTAAELRQRNAELHAQRDATARLAVDADRSRITADLDATLRRHIEQIAGTAAGIDPRQRAAAEEALSTIETTGREALRHMREVVGALRPADRSPSPVLSQLEGLLERATSSQTRLAVVGTPFELPAGVELSGYRIVEHLLTALDNASDARADVTLRFSAQALGIEVRGSAGRAAARAAAVAAASERTALHGGRLEERVSGSRYEVTVRLPLVSSGA